MRQQSLCARFRSAVPAIGDTEELLELLRIEVMQCIQTSAVEVDFDGWILMAMQCIQTSAVEVDSDKDQRARLTVLLPVCTISQEVALATQARLADTVRSEIERLVAIEKRLEKDSSRDTNMPAQHEMKPC